MTLPTVAGRNEKTGDSNSGVAFTNAGGDFDNVKATGADMWAFVAASAGTTITSISTTGATWTRFGYISATSGVNKCAVAIYYRKWTGATTGANTANDVTFNAAPASVNSPITVEIVRVANGSQVVLVGGGLIKQDVGGSSPITPNALTAYVNEGLALYWLAATDNAPDDWTASGTGWTQEVATSNDPGSGLRSVLASGPQSFSGGINTTTVPTFSSSGGSQSGMCLGILIAGDGNVPLSAFVYDWLPAKLSDSLADINWSATDIANLGLMDGDLMVNHLAANRLAVNEGIYPPDGTWISPAPIAIGEVTTTQRLSHTVAMKIYTGSDSGGFTFTCATNNSSHGFIGTLFRVLGVNRVNPVNAKVGTSTPVDISNGTTFTVADLTSTVNNCLIMRFGAGSSASTRTFSWGDGTELTDDSTDPGGAVMTSMSWKTKLGIGAVGTAAITMSSTTQCIHGGQIAIEPFRRSGVPTNRRIHRNVLLRT